MYGPRLEDSEPTPDEVQEEVLQSQQFEGDLDTEYIADLLNDALGG